MHDPIAAEEKSVLVAESRRGWVRRRRCRRLHDDGCGGVGDVGRKNGANERGNKRTREQSEAPALLLPNPSTKPKVGDITHILRQSQWTIRYHPTRSRPCSRMLLMTSTSSSWTPTLGRPSTRLLTRLEWVYNYLVTSSCTRGCLTLSKGSYQWALLTLCGFGASSSSMLKNILTSLYPGWAADNVRDSFDRPSTCSYLPDVAPSNSHHPPTRPRPIWNI
jgi:hypothetical protein